MSLDMNLGDVVEGLIAGEYKVNIVGCEEKTSKAGNPYARWQLSVFDAIETKYNGQVTWHSTPTTGKGAFRLVQLFKAAVKDTKALNTMSTMTFEAVKDCILGKQVAITVVESHDQEGNLNGFVEVKNVKSL